MSTADNAPLATAQGPSDRDGLDAVDRELAKLLARGLTYGEAGSMLGISKSTVARRMADPRFRAAVNRERAIGVEDFLAGQIASAEASLAYLHEVVADGARPDAVRVKAASAILAGLPRWRGHAALPTNAVTPAEAKAELMRRFLELRNSRRESDSNIDEIEVSDESQLVWDSPASISP